MKKFPACCNKFINNVVFGSLVLLLATPSFAETRYEYAQVVESQAVYKLVEISIPHEECWNEEVAHTRSARSNSRTPALLATIIGGALGNAVGHGKSNKRVGAVVGAVLGHSVGRDIVAGNSHDRVVRYETVRQCETVYEYREEERLVGYRVVYRYNDEDYSVRMDDDPGEQVRIKVDIQPML